MIAVEGNLPPVARDLAVMGVLYLAVVGLLRTRLLRAPAPGGPEQLGLAVPLAVRERSLPGRRQLLLARPLSVLVSHTSAGLKSSGSIL